MKSFFTVPCAIAGVLLMLIVGSCKKEKNVVQYPIPSNLVMVSSGYASGAAIRVEVYAAYSLFVGYNQVYLALYDSVSNKRLTQSQISLSAMVNAAGGAEEAGPVENPVGYNADNGLFNAAVVFVTSANNWVLGARVLNPLNNAWGSFISTVNVVQASPAKAYSVVTQDDNSNLFVAMVQPGAPQIGGNNFELAIYKQTGAGNFVPDSNYTIGINPQMPSMSGMTSPNNVNPTYTGNGHYQGKVIFTMFGAWEIDIRLLHNTAVADTSHYFDINLST